MRPYSFFHEIKATDSYFSPFDDEKTGPICMIIPKYQLSLSTD